MAQMELPLETQNPRDEPTLTLRDIEYLYNFLEFYTFATNELRGLLITLGKPGALEKLNEWLEAKEHPHRRAVNWSVP